MLYKATGGPPVDRVRGRAPEGIISGPFSHSRLPGKLSGGTGDWKVSRKSIKTFLPKAGTTEFLT